MVESPTHTEGESSPGEETAEGKQQHRHYLEYVKVIVVTVLVALFLKTFVVEAYQIPSGSMENTLLVGDYLIVNKLAYGFRTPRHVPFTNLAMPSLTMPLFGRVHRGDVVVFEYPGPYDEVTPVNPVNYVKRCIGLPRDTIRIVHGVVFVNGKPIGLPPRAKPVDVNELFNTWPRATPFPPGSMYTLFDYGPIGVPKQGDTVRLNSSSLARWQVFVEREGHSVFADEHGQIYVDGIRTDHYVVERNYYFMLGDNRDNSLDSRFWGFVPEKNIVGEALLVYWSWNSDSSTPSLMARPGSIRWNRIGTIVR